MANAEPPARSLEILLIEDDPDDVLFAKEALRSVKFKAHVTVASTAKEGLASATRRKGREPDVILLDLRLPGANGAELIRDLRAAGVQAPCIIVTGMPDQARLLESAMLALGAVEILHKPYEASDLGDTIEAALRAKPHAPRGEVRKGAIRLDPVFRRVWVRNRLIGHLPPRRFALLTALARAAGALAREHLLRTIWDGSDDPQIVAKTIQRLRQDLGPDAELILARPDGYELAG
jgi:DNA-binding response OmpR family regulator